MSKILVVEPAKMLQQALVFALASEHEIQVVDQLPEPAALQADIAMIDPAVLIKSDAAAARARATILSWQIPIIWLGSEWPSSERAPAKLVCVKPPFDRESLKKALADIVRSSTKENNDTHAHAPKLKQTPVARQTKAREPRPSSVTESKNDIIELVDVVEEQPLRGPNKDAGKNS
jgi:hypothetical protein